MKSVGYSSGKVLNSRVYLGRAQQKRGLTLKHRPRATFVGYAVSASAAGDKHLSLLPKVQRTQVLSRLGGKKSSTSRGIDFGAREGAFNYKLPNRCERAVGEVPETSAAAEKSVGETCVAERV